MNYLDKSKYELRPRGAFVHVFDKSHGAVTRLIPAGDPRVTVDCIADAAPAKPNGTEMFTDKQIRELVSSPATEKPVSSFFNGVSYEEGMKRMLDNLLGVKSE